MFARLSTVVLYALLVMTSIATAIPNPDVVLARVHPPDPGPGLPIPRPPKFD
ncbi:hypothetical protein M405DRAFT_935561 [Rhizopogon salebrosus TDB-379]|nr:hypothetical protein M405DRAFT_935561 [Rhizopogon salebrosus TDB-379]